MEPFEIIAAPFEVWIAEIDTAFPAIDEEPSGDWTLLGTAGKRNMNEDGVTVTHDQTIERDKFRMLGTTGARKAVRTAEDLTIEFILHDLTLEMYADALGVGEYEDGIGDVIKTTNTVGDDPGYKQMGLLRGLEVREVALLVRGPSPYIANYLMQYEVPRCFQNGNPAPVFRKDAPAGLQFQFVALEVSTLDEDAGESQRFGRITAAHEPPVPT